MMSNHSTLTSMGIDRYGVLATFGLISACAVPFIDPYDAGIPSTTDAGPTVSCPAVSISTAMIESQGGSVTKLIDLDGERLLAIVRGADPTKAVELDTSGRSRPATFDFNGMDVTTGAVLGTRVYFSAWLRPDNRSQLLFADSSGGTLTATGAPALEPFNRMKMAPDRLEVLAIGHGNMTAALYRLDATSTASVWNNTRGKSDDEQDADIVWLSNAEAVILPFDSYCAGMTSPCLIGYDGSAAVEHPLELQDEEDRASAIAEVSGVGQVLGTKKGRFFVRRDSTLERLADAPAPDRPARHIVRRIRPFGAWFVAITDEDMVFYDVAAKAFCETRLRIPSGFGFVYTAVVIDNTLFLSGLSGEGRPLTVDVIRLE